MSLRPANQIEIERLMRDGWYLQHSAKRVCRPWILYRGQGARREAHGGSVNALIKLGKIVQRNPAQYGLTWYQWKGEQQ